MKKRVDDLLVERGLAKDRDQALRQVMAREVFLPNRAIQSAAEHIDITLPLEIKPRHADLYVSRGGYKLEAALSHFSIDVRGKKCLDIGISTGGFSDCLLQHGAHHVYGIDVGYGQIHHRLRNNPRLTVFERTHILNFNFSEIKNPISIITMDLSFISAQKVVSFISKSIGDGCLQTEKVSKTGVVCLLKPQFELDRTQVATGGIADYKLGLDCVKDTLAFAEKLGLGEGHWIPSPLLGRKGNQEYLLYWQVANHSLLTPNEDGWPGESRSTTR